MSALFQCKPKPPYLKSEEVVVPPPKPEYKVVYADCSNDLEKEVNALLAEGWTPAGGVQVILDRHLDAGGVPVVEWDFHQAMTR